MATLAIDGEGRVGSVLVGRYALDVLLGCGGFGWVYRARDLLANTSNEGSGAQLLAVKLLHRSLLGDREILRRFDREARAAARIEHENVTRVLGFDYSEAGEPYLLLEYVEGESLADVLRGGAPPWPRAHAILQQVAAALEAAHAAGVVHRDLKASNVMLTASDRVKVLDFGLAKIIAGENTTLTADGLGYGTPEYMAPELLDEKPGDARSDVYAFGILAYELALGTLPFTGKLLEVLHAQLHEPIPKASAVTRRPELAPFDSFVERCCAKDPGARFADGRALGVALQGLAGLAG